MLTPEEAVASSKKFQPRWQAKKKVQLERIIDWKLSREACTLVGFPTHEVFVDLKDCSFDAVIDEVLAGYKAVGWLPVYDGPVAGTYRIGFMWPKQKEMQ